MQLPFAFVFANQAVAKCVYNIVLLYYNIVMELSLSKISFFL